MSEFEESDFSDDDSGQSTDVSSNVLIAVDCKSSMFKPSETLNGLTGFQTALQALYRVNDGLILNKTTKNKIAIAFFHPDKQILMDFDSPFAETSIKLKKLAHGSLSDLDEYNKDKVTTKLSFSHFLIECRKRFKKVKKNDAKHFFFVTNDPDPCENDNTVKFQALREFPEFTQLNIKFELLPLVEEFDYNPFFGEAYENIKMQVPKYYYNVDFLTSKIRNAVKFRSINKKIQLHISSHPASNIFIPCFGKSYCKKAKLFPNKSMTRDLQNPVIREKEKNHNATYLLNISKEVYGEDIILNKTDKLRLYHTEDVKLGITIVHASKKRYSTLGENLQSPFLLRPKASNSQEFNALWEACVKDSYYLLCHLKYRIVGKVHDAELIPKIINHERQFLVVTMPHATDVYKPENRDVVVEDDKELNSLFNDLVNLATIENYDVTKLRPYKFTQQAKYFKKELLGPDYEGGSEILDLVNEKQYEGDISEIIERLSILYPAMAKNKRAKSQAATTSKRSRK